MLLQRNHFLAHQKARSVTVFLDEPNSRKNTKLK